ncbi:DUF3618 domain-containing protein [Streptomyces sp. SCSIO 75703]|uniref:DUF3618 domain-containing protein n=1 Tax=unclassified Streptomyces TaxID=2593676 RepID=UPI0004BEC2A5|nr:MULTISPECIES: DUF3618 domain-containing protein [unclassified Streptomyces]
MTDTTDGADAARAGSTAEPATGAKGPDELRRQIERTRRQLGDTVEELAGKADVKGRARTRAADLRDKAGAARVQLRSSAAQAGHGVRGRAHRAGDTARGRAPGPVTEDEVRPGRRPPPPVLVAGAVAGAAVAAGVLRRRHGPHH